eukprot:jgi/Phyca11/132450/e_gw1.167.4.1
MASSGTTDGDVEMPLAQPTYEYIRAPRLTEWSQPALVEYQRQRRRCEEKIQERCSATGEAAYAKSVLEVTDDDLVRAIKVKAGNMMNDYVPDLDKLFDQLKMNMQQSDIEARVAQYFIDFDRIVEEHGLVGVLDRQGTSNPVHAKMRFRLLVRRLQPEVLRREIERLAQVTHRHVKTDGIALYELIVDRAKRQHQAHLLNLELKAARGPRVNESKQETGRNNQTAKSASSGGSLRRAGQERSERSNNSRGSQPSRENYGGTGHRNEPPCDGCLPCKGAHWLKDCPTARRPRKRRHVSVSPKVRSRGAIESSI